MADEMERARQEWFKQQLEIAKADSAFIPDIFQMCIRGGFEAGWKAAMEHIRSSEAINITSPRKYPEIKEFPDRYNRVVGGPIDDDEY